VGLVDVFDALTSDRPYKRAWSYEETLEFIRKQRGAHFDPQLVDLFESHFNEFQALFEYPSGNQSPAGNKKSEENSAGS
jgi:putative two-component system response regulator